MSKDDNQFPAGNCFQNSYVLFTALCEHGAIEPITSRLCHGVVRRSCGNFERMGHAWIEAEWNGVTYCIDHSKPTTPIPQKQYYTVGRIKDVVRYTLEDARRESLKDESYGPWNEKLMKAAYANGGGNR